MSRLREEAVLEAAAAKMPAAAKRVREPGSKDFVRNERELVRIIACLSTFEKLLAHVLALGRNPGLPASVSRQKMPHSLLNDASKVVAGVLKKCSVNMRYSNDYCVQKDSGDRQTIHGNLRRTGPVFFTGFICMEPRS
jgi:hypothetical protein